MPISGSIAIALSALADVQLARRGGARPSVGPRAESELAEFLDWTSFTWTIDWKVDDSIVTSPLVYQISNQYMLSEKRKQDYKNGNQAQVLTVMIGHILERGVNRILHVCSRWPMPGICLIANLLAIEDIGLEVVSLLHPIRQHISFLVVSTLDFGTGIDGMSKSVTCIADQTGHNSGGKTSYKTDVRNGKGSRAPECQLDGGISPSPPFGKLDDLVDLVRCDVSAVRPFDGSVWVAVAVEREPFHGHWTAEGTDIVPLAEMVLVVR